MLLRFVWLVICLLGQLILKVACLLRSGALLALEAWRLPSQPLPQPPQPRTEDQQQLQSAQQRGEEKQGQKEEEPQQQPPPQQSDQQDEKEELLHEQEWPQTGLEENIAEPEAEAAADAQQKEGKNEEPVEEKQSKEIVEPEAEEEQKEGEKEESVEEEQKKDFKAVEERKEEVVDNVQSVKEKQSADEAKEEELEEEVHVEEEKREVSILADGRSDSPEDAAGESVDDEADSANAEAQQAAHQDCADYALPTVPSTDGGGDAPEDSPSVSPPEKKKEVEEDEDEDEAPPAEALVGDDNESASLWQLRTLRCHSEGRLAQFASAVEEVKRKQRGLRFSVHSEADLQVAKSIAVLGPGAIVQSACAALRAALGSDASAVEEESIEHFFALHFSMRESWDLPQDDELLDASIEDSWIDLGTASSPSKRPPSSAEGEEPSAIPRAPRSPTGVLRGRVLEVLPRDQNFHLFMDSNPYAAWGDGLVRVDILAPLTPEAWQAASRAVLACEAHRVYLSRSYDAVFWCSPTARRLIEGQVSNALSHWKGKRLAPGDAAGAGGVGVSGSAFRGFEDLATNVGAVLHGAEPPGWHRLEWTPHGEGSVPYMTY